MACTASVQKGNLSWPPTLAWRTADHSLTAFVLICCRAYTSELLSAQPSLGSFVRATAATTELLVTRIGGSRFTLLHLNVHCVTRPPCIQILPEGVWLFALTLSGSLLIACIADSWLNFPEEDQILVRGLISYFMSSSDATEVSSEILQPKKSKQWLSQQEVARSLQRVVDK